MRFSQDKGSPGLCSKEINNKLVNIVGGNACSGTRGDKPYRAVNNNPDEKVLNLLSLNVCGIISKLRGIELENIISGYDCVLLTETKLAANCSLHIDGFTTFQKTRQNAKSASGGVAILIKSDLEPYFEVTQGKCDFAVWLKSSILNPCKVLLGVVYIPPENSKYSSINMFDYSLRQQKNEH